MSDLSRFRPVVIVRAFLPTATCYAGSIGRVRPQVVMKLGGNMKSTIKAFNREENFDVALEEDSEIYLIGISFNYGPAEHTNYYVIPKDEF